MTKNEVHTFCFANGYEASYSGHSQHFTIKAILPRISEESLLANLNFNGVTGIRIKSSRFNFITKTNNNV